jgi:hypothetical protein
MTIHSVVLQSSESAQDLLHAVSLSLLRVPAASFLFAIDIRFPEFSNLDQKLAKIIFLIFEGPTGQPNARAIPVTSRTIFRMKIARYVATGFQTRDLSLARSSL